MIEEIDRWLTEKVAQYKARSLYLPAGQTVCELYAHWCTQPHPSLQKLELYQVDEIIEGHLFDRFGLFFEQELPGFKVHPPTIDVQADLAILGLGRNGHVAFHEPGIRETFRFGAVTLTDETTRYLGVPVGTRAVTFGLGAFLKTKAVLLLVSGEGKKEAYERFLARDPALPATALYKHPDFRFFVDL